MVIKLLLHTYVAILVVGFATGYYNLQHIANTSVGRVLGSLMTSRNGRSFLAFRGVPYGKPPIGQLRFRDPQPAGGWSGLLNATQEGPSCIQYDFIVRIFRGIEDCLVLNVYTHQATSKNLRPVMVWIHGGGWVSGSGNGDTDFYGPQYFLDQDIVLVTINYRLGPFGFLSTEDEVAPGNYGMLDQTLALKWIRDHISHFGGDPNSVTIFGESAGAGSVYHHLLSPRSKGLFHRAIAQSGASTCRWAYADTVGIYTNHLAEYFQCSKSTSQETVDCLRNIPADDIAHYRLQIQTISAFPIGFQPRIDTERKSPFLPGVPKELIEKGQFSQVPLIIGMNRNEGIFFLSDLLANNETNLKKLESDPEKYLPAMLGYDYHPNSSRIVRNILNQYLKPGISYNQQLTGLEQLFSDGVFMHCIDESIDLNMRYNQNPTYIYWYTHRGQFTIPQVYGISNTKLGVSHFDEIPILFHNNITPPLNQNDTKVSKILVDFWTSFAQKGKPKSDSSVTWRSSTITKPHYLDIDVNPVLNKGYFPFRQREATWTQIIQQSTS